MPSFLPQGSRGRVWLHVRVWGEVDGRLIEVRLAPGPSAGGLSIHGLPGERIRTTRDRVRSALLNSGLVSDEPCARIVLAPVLAGGSARELDLPIAIAALLWRRGWSEGTGWIFATGRLGLDGSVNPDGPEPRATLTEVAARACRTGELPYRTYVREENP